MYSGPAGHYWVNQKFWVNSGEYEIVKGKTSKDMYLTDSKLKPHRKVDILSKFKNSWGLYPWFIEDGENFIFPSDLESFKKLLPYGKVFNCINEGDGYLVIQYGKGIFRVKSDLYKIVNKPRFEIGCNVKLAKDNTQEGIIEEINWHQKNNAPIYYISINGKRKSTRYSDEDLITI